MRSRLSILWLFVWWVLLAGLANATSVAPEDFKCPVCGESSVDSVLMSYNNFGGPPPRDRIFVPMGARVRICPRDLYASWNYRWEELKEGEKERLAMLLKNPSVVLTDEEKKIIGPVTQALRESRWWELLWARTCDQARKTDVDHARFTALQFYYAGDAHSKEPWVKELSAHYRDQAIKALAGSNITHHRFLRAELLRLAGRTEEAAPVFRKLAAELAKPAPKADEAEDREGLKSLCEEGLFLIEAEGLPSARIAGWLLQPFPQPDLSGETKPPAGWSRHRIGLQVLVTRAIAGEKAAGEFLWKQLSQDARRLVALDETMEGTPGAPEAKDLRNCGGSWTKWLDELAARAISGKLPDALKKHPNRERCLNILKSFGPPASDYLDECWQKTTLLAAVLQADKSGKIPDLDIARNDLAYALARLAEKDDEHKEAVLKTIIRVLKELPKPAKTPNYGFRLAAVTLAKQMGNAKSIAAGIEGEWKCDWWKLVAEYATGIPGAGPAMADDPLVSKSFGDDGKALECLVWQLLAVRKDPIWKTKTLKVIQSAAWLPDEPIEYAQSLGDKEVDAALEKRVVRLRNNRTTDSNGDMSLYEIKSMEDRTRQTRMAALTVR